MERGWGLVVGDSGRGAEPHIRWLVTQILSNFAVAAPGEWIPAVSVGKTAAPKERTVLSAAPRSASLIPVENTDSVNLNCRAFGET